MHLRYQISKSFIIITNKEYAISRKTKSRQPTSIPSHEMELSSKLGQLKLTNYM